MKMKVPDPFFVKRLKHFLSFFIASLAVFLLLTAQVKQGDLSEAYPKAEFAEIELPQGKVMISSDHLAPTGGIAFYQIAKPLDNIKVQSLDINYQPHQADGRRLKLIINDKEIDCALSDWQLIPIVKYADSPYNSCITLSGHLVDKSLEENIKNNGGHIINYHPAFYNTVLGWYLKQTDILLLDRQSVRTPEINDLDSRRYREFDIPIEQKESAFKDTQDMLLELQANMRGKHRSWLISDYSKDIRFDIFGDDLSIEAEASIFCWRFLSDAPSLVKDSNKVRIDAMKSILRHEFDTDIEFYNKGHYTEDAYRTRLMKRIARTLPTMLERHYNISKINIPESDLNKLMSAYRADDLQTHLNIYTTQKLVDLWNISTLINSLYYVVPLDEYNQSLSENQRLIRAVNPDAWDATLLAMKYSAFFRYVKQSFPQQWKEFMVLINKVGEEDLLQTPTALYPSDNLFLKQLLN